MDTLTLVERQIQDGESLLTQLKKEGFAVRAAFWAKPSDEDRWSLYLATPAVKAVGTLADYRLVLQAFRSLGQLSFQGWDVIKLISDKHPISRGVLDLLKRFPDFAGKPLSRSQLGDLPFEEVCIYALGEMRITIYGMVYRGEPSGALILSFKPHNSHSKLEVESRGVRHEYPAETGLDWLIAAPEGATLTKDGSYLDWDFRGTPKQSSANEVMALADLGLHGFRILSGPANLKTAS